MALDLIKNTLKYTIFLGLIGLFISWAFGLQSTFAETRIINGQEILVFSWYNYINSLNNAWTTTALNFDDIIPPGSWVEITGNILQEEFWVALGQNMQYFFNWIIFIPNFSAYIFRWFCWIIRLTFALIGWDFSITDGEYNSNIIKILTWITQNLVIPYVS